MRVIYVHLSTIWGYFLISVSMPIDDIICTAMVCMDQNGKFIQCLNRVRKGPYHRAMDQVCPEGSSSFCMNRFCSFYFSLTVTVHIAEVHIPNNNSP